MNQDHDLNGSIGVKLADALTEAIRLEGMAKIADKRADEAKEAAKQAASDAQAAWSAYRKILMEVEQAYYRARRP